jgi:hypothetical protein
VVSHFEYVTVRPVLIFLNNYYSALTSDASKTKTNDHDEIVPKTGYFVAARCSRRILTGVLIGYGGKHHCTNIDSTETIKASRKKQDRD